MGWCGPAKHLSLPRSHIFPYQGLTARRGVYFGLYRIHRCMRHCGSTTSLLIPPPLRSLRLLRLLLPPSRPLPRRCFVVYAVLSANQVSSPMANAKGAAIPPLTILLLGTRRSSLKDLRGVIQVLHLKAQLLQLVRRFLRILLLLLSWGSPCRNGRGWYPHRTVKQGPQRSSFFLLFHCAGLR